MAEYISKEAIIKELEEEIEADNVALDEDVWVNKGLKIALKDIKNQLSADVQLIKKGHWYHNTSKYISELDAYFIQACCSCCGKYSDRVDLYSTIMSNEMCSHCGAKMIKNGDANG